MTTTFNLSLPQDIPWERICVTNDMIDRAICDNQLPPKWQTSLAVFKYVPADDYQLFPAYKITYLKVTATLTGYQPLNEEIQGTIDWDGVNVETIDGLTELLQSYHPCNGAILQVVVGPPPGRDVPLDQYPFFLDFEPKKRELYELASDTRERQSRSIESVNIGKSAGSTQSTEVLDVDMGGSTSFGAEGSFAGTGGGFNFASSNSGQWGTKSLNSQQSQSTRTTDVGQEKRETYSFTTQLSQMYHLLDSYHLGTNRAVFFVQPRPHVLEEPSGFVRGPRPVEGIQEFLLIVAQPKQAADFCLSVRLDTSHIAETDILEYEDRTDISELASANARVPTRNDIPDGSTTRRACFIDCWNVNYSCFRTDSVSDQVYTAPEGYVIVGYDDLVNDASHGTTSVTVAPGGKTLTVHAEAHGHICFEGSGVCVDCPDEVDKWAGSARRQVQVRLRSEEPTKKVGTKQTLLITTRGLCCCHTNPNFDGRVTITAIKDIPTAWLLPADGVLQVADARPAPSVDIAYAPRDGSEPQPVRYLPAEVLDRAPVRTLSAPLTVAAPSTSQAYGCNCNDKAPPAAAAWAMPSGRAMIRRANAMVGFIRDEMIKSFNDPHPDHVPRPFQQTDAFLVQLTGHVQRTRTGRRELAKPVLQGEGKIGVPRHGGPGGPPPPPPGPSPLQQLVKAVAKALGKPEAQVSTLDLMRFRNSELVKSSKVPYATIAAIKLNLLGVPFKKDPGKK
jgi:hypothetical protein